MDSKVLIKIIETIDNPILLANIFIFIALVFLFKKDLSNLFNKLFISGKKLPKVHKVSHLINHDVFSALNRATSEVRVMKFYTHGKYDEVKSRMCYDFTKQKAKYCTLRMKEILETPNIDKMPVDKLRALITNSQNQMHTNYINAIRNEWFSKGIAEDDVEYIVHLFEKFRYDVVNSFDHRIAANFGSGFNRTNFDIMLEVFSMWAMGIDLLPRDMQITFENLNGRFKNIKY